MFDAAVMRVVRRPLDQAGRTLSQRGVAADTVTWVGFGFGLAAALAVVVGAYGFAAVLVVINRVCDGLDGAIARATGPTDYGGYLDIVLDFLFYGAFVLAFALNDPAQGVAAAFLIFSFFGTGASFLAYAILAAKRGQTTDARGKKSFFYLGGLTEGTETTAVFLLMAMWPESFAYLAWGFGALCWITTATRIQAAHRAFGAAP